MLMVRERPWWVPLLGLAGLFLGWSGPCTRLSAAGVPAAGVVPSDSGEKVRKLQEDLDAIQVQMDFLQMKVRDTRHRVKSLEQRIAEQKQRVDGIMAQLETVTRETETTRNQITALQDEIAAGQAREQEILLRFRTRLIQLHRVKQGTLLNSIFAARDLNSFLNRYQMVRFLLSQDRELLTEWNHNRLRLQSNVETLERKRLRLEELGGVTERKRKDMEIETNSLSAMLQTLLLERRLFLSRQEKLKQSRSQLEDEITRIEQDRSANPVDWDKMLTPPPVGKTEPPLIPVAPASAPAVSPAGGQLSSTGFGWPVATVEKLRFDTVEPQSPPCLELLLAKEMEIKAAARGKVLFKGPLGQFGNLVILGHKRGFSSVYGRLDDMWVGLGQVVEAGEVIGRVLGGRQGRLHFEIRLAGKNQDPLAFLPPIP